MISKQCWWGDHGSLPSPHVSEDLEKAMNLSPEIFCGEICGGVAVAFGAVHWLNNQSKILDTKLTRSRVRLESTTVTDRILRFSPGREETSGSVGVFRPWLSACANGFIAKCWATRMSKSKAIVLNQKKKSGGVQIYYETLVHEQDRVRAGSTDQRLVSVECVALVSCGKDLLVHQHCSPHLWSWDVICGQKQKILNVKDSSELSLRNRTSRSVIQEEAQSRTSVHPY